MSQYQDGMSLYESSIDRDEKNELGKTLWYRDSCLKMDRLETEGLIGEVFSGVSRLLFV